jgi:S1-C subfamily serine protease
MRALPLFCAVSLLIGCGGETPPAASPKAPVVEAPKPVEPGPKDSVSRASVDAALKAGLGRFLANLDVEPALEGKKKFVGWRIVELRGAMWTGVDLQVGDVVTSVNGFKIERESEANKAFQSLSVASEIRVSLIRGEKPMELRFSIVDEK